MNSASTSMTSIPLARQRCGIAIRCHAYSPRVMENARRAGLGRDEQLADWLRAGLIDTLSDDDVGWLNEFVQTAGA